MPAPQPPTSLGIGSGQAPRGTCHSERSEESAVLCCKPDSSARTGPRNDMVNWRHSAILEQSLVPSGGVMTSASGPFAVTGGNPLLLPLCPPAAKPIQEKSAGTRRCASLGAQLGSFRNTAKFPPPPAIPRPFRSRGMIAVSGPFAVTGGNPLLLQIRRPEAKPIHENSAAKPPPGSPCAELGSFRNTPKFPPPPAKPRPFRDRPGLTPFPGSLSRFRSAPIRCERAIPR